MGNSDSEPNRGEMAEGQPERLPERKGTRKTTNRERDDIPRSSYANAAKEHIHLSSEAQKSLDNLDQFQKGLSEKLLHFDDKTIYLIKEQASTYEGDFKNRLPHGEGIVHFRSGSFYSGQFENGEACGSGIYIFKNGSVYSGQFKNSVFHGQGTLCDKQKGFTYKGDWKEGSPDGRGKENYLDSGFYDGQFEKGLKHGKGKLRWADGTEYRGEFRNNLMEGQGILQKNDITIFQGQFRKGMKYGNGVLQTKVGTFMGNFKDDYLEGEGTFVWREDGKLYEGNFKRSQFDGKGVIYYPSNQVAQGVWEDNHNIRLSELKYDESARDKINRVKQMQKSPASNNLLNLDSNNEQGFKETSSNYQNAERQYQNGERQYQNY